MGGSRAGSQNSIAVRSRRGSKVSGSKGTPDIEKGKDGGAMGLNSITIEDMNSSRMSEGRNSLASYTIFPPTEKLGFNILKDVSARPTRHNIDPERQWAKKLTNEVKPIYNPEQDAKRGIFRRLAEKDLRERRFQSFMSKTGKEMEENSKKERELLMKKMIK
jgi:hypothetical protein